MMMKITRMGEYAVLGLIYVSQQEGKKVLIREVSGNLGLPQKFMAKIFQRLAKYGILRSYRGKGGGFILNVAPESLTLRAIIEAVQGPSIIMWCVAGEVQCHRYLRCPLEDIFKKAQELLDEHFDNITLEGLASECVF
jgi:Rrf2 family protein